MGAVTFSIDPNLIDAIQKNSEIDLFIETGTFEGHTLDLVQGYFSEIHSIELSEHYYKLSKNRFAKETHINLILGDSATELAKLKDIYRSKNTIFWLDAHWCQGDSTAGSKSQSPLLAELSAIEYLNEASIIIIDDARLYTATPLYPHEVSQWPSFSEVVTKLTELSDKHQLSIINDCMIYHPKFLSEAIKNYGYYNGIDWLAILNNNETLQVFREQCDERLKTINHMDKQIKQLERQCHQTEKALQDMMNKKLVFKFKKKMKSLYIKCFS